MSRSLSQVLNQLNPLTFLKQNATTNLALQYVNYGHAWSGAAVMSKLPLAFLTWTTSGLQLERRMIQPTLQRRVDHWGRKGVRRWDRLRTLKGRHKGKREGEQTNCSFYF